MSLVRLLPAWFVPIADHAVAALLILVPLFAGGTEACRLPQAWSW